MLNHSETYSRCAKPPESHAQSLPKNTHRGTPHLSTANKQKHNKSLNHSIIDLYKILYVSTKRVAL